MPRKSINKQGVISKKRILFTRTAKKAVVKVLDVSDRVKLNFYTPKEEACNYIYVRSNTQNEPIERILNRSAFEVLHEKINTVLSIRKKKAV